VAVLATALLGATTAGSADEPKASPRVIRVTAEATVHAVPDLAEIDLGVMTEAVTASEAASENAKRVDKVLGAIRGLAGVKAELKTVGYSVSPRYAESKGGRPPAVAGYAAENVVRVRTGDLTQVSALIDAATGAGANDVRGLQFSRKDEDAVRAQALREAVAKAKLEAETIADSLGVKIGRVISAETSAEPPIGRPMMAMAMKGAGEATHTPVEPGTIDMHASIAIAFEAN
jgi:uncharacterized protein YggE